MIDVFRDQGEFMLACEQTVGEVNYAQKLMYLKLISEEFNELKKADTAEEELDALIDILVVTIGALHSGGYDAAGAWQEVMRTNRAKIDPATGQVKKRKDGKVIKPVGWKAPNLTPFVRWR